jgi:hypothetical protein
MLKLQILGCDKPTPLKRNLVLRFKERRNKEEGDKQDGHPLLSIDMQFFLIFILS